MSSLEIEIKSLLGTPEKAEELRVKVRERNGLLVGQGKQRNHYFHNGNVEPLADIIAPICSDADAALVRKIATQGKAHSVRTRDADGTVILVIKASLDASTSANGVSRMECEVVLPMSLEDLDALVTKAGYEYQAKWSREREEYRVDEVTVTIDRNAGYGYLAEFERVVPEGTAHDQVAEELRAFMATLGADELPQDRLERMFAYYNSHWPEYYGTEKTFVIE
jgi:adenylate cyclase class IV